MASKRALMATHDPGDRVQLPGGYWLEKQDDNGWWLGHVEAGNTATKLVPSVPVGLGGSIDATIDEFAAAMNHAQLPAPVGEQACVRCGAPESLHPAVNFWNSEWHGGVVRVCPTGTFAAAGDRAYYRPMPIGTACARCRYGKAEHRQDGDMLWCPTAKFTYLQEGR
jgi:hypothetical protein